MILFILIILNIVAFIAAADVLFAIAYLGWFQFIGIKKIIKEYYHEKVIKY
jgi:hypothetical protein